MVRTGAFGACRLVKSVLESMGASSWDAETEAVLVVAVEDYVQRCVGASDSLRRAVGAAVVSQSIAESACDAVGRSAFSTDPGSVENVELARRINAQPLTVPLLDLDELLLPPAAMRELGAGPK